MKKPGGGASLELARRNGAAAGLETAEPGTGQREDCGMLDRSGKLHHRPSKSRSWPFCARSCCCWLRPQSQGHGGHRGKWRKALLAAGLSAVASLVVCSTMLFMHVAIKRSACYGRLHDVLAIFQAAHYHPIMNGFHSHQPDMSMHFARALQVLEGGLDHSARRELKAGVAVYGGAGPKGASLIGNTLVSAQIKPVGRSPCAVTYTMNITEAEAKAIDLDQYDQELLGTIMVRLCQCRCGGAANPPLNESISLMEEILRGAHVVVRGDRGGFYSWFMQMQDSYKRTSSHRSIVEQYGIDEGAVLRTLLTGRDVNGDTWFQMEGAMWAPFRHPFDSLIHAVNYIQYKFTGQQIGPLGTSRHTDRRPIRIAWDGCRDTHRLLFREYDPDDPTGKDPALVAAQIAAVQADAGREHGASLGFLRGRRLGAWRRLLSVDE